MDPIFQLPPVTRHYTFSTLAAEQEQWWRSDVLTRELSDWAGGGRGVRVGIVDTGIDKTHLEAGELNVAAAADFTGSRNSFYDGDGHGSHVAGIIGAVQGNGRGVVGMAPQVSLVICKGLGDNGTGSDRSIAAAIDRCVAEGCTAINLSLGSESPSPLIRAAIDRAGAKGCIVFAAAGNGGGKDNVGYPAHDENCFAVGAVDRRKQLANFSDQGPQVDGVGFGVQMKSLYKGGVEAVLSGTSMATPWIVGAFALRQSAELKYLGKLATRTLDDCIKLFAASADDLGTGGRDQAYGYGFPLLAKLIKQGLEVTVPPIDPQQPQVIAVGNVRLMHPAQPGGVTFSVHT